MALEVVVEFVIDSENWVITEGKRKVALLVMDHMLQIDQVILGVGITKKERLFVLRLAASHVARYVVQRTRYSSVFASISRDAVTDDQSPQMVQDGIVPKEVARLSDEQLVRELKRVGIDVITGGTDSFQTALETVLSDSKLKAVSFTLGRKLGRSQLHSVTSKVSGKQTFRAWHSVGTPGGPMDLHIIPDYHPDVIKGKNSAWLVNGDTAALIRGVVVRSVHTPKGSTPGGTGGSWNGINHPFYAEGKEIALDISTTQVLGAEGMSELKSLLFALLGLDNTYLSVSGGFDGPYEYSLNVARRAGIRTSCGDGKARGTEGCCVWAYETLEKEGKLKDAYVPRGLPLRAGWTSTRSTAVAK